MEGISICFDTVPQDLDDVTDNSSAVINGSVVLLFCSAIGDTAPPSISWTRDGGDPESPPLIHITTTVTNLTILTSSMVTIREFSPATAGLYVCRASLQGNTLQSSITLTGESMALGTTVILICLLLSISCYQHNTLCHQGVNFIRHIRW